ncbi:hypothetical protein [Lysinibacillus xylanilyticus]|uniref:hypothetical protein n=1 Tax=Lysinibacillus xylanilyticus TaxID=582475 RepID=UPI00382665AF
MRESVVLTQRQQQMFFARKSSANAAATACFCLRKSEATAKGFHLRESEVTAATIRCWSLSRCHRAWRS